MFRKPLWKIRDATPSPAESLALIAAERQHADRRLGDRPGPVLALWGAAWLIGFGDLYMAWSVRNGQWLSRSTASVILVALFAAAYVVSVGRGLWRQRGLAGPSQLTARLYLYSWIGGIAALWAVNLRLIHDGVPVRLRPLLWSGSSLLLVGILLIAGGLLWDDRIRTGLGGWTVLIGGASVFAGVPGNFAVLALAGGGGLLLGAAGLGAQPLSRSGQERPGRTHR